MNLGIAIYGGNGHQINEDMIKEAGGVLTGICEADADKFPGAAVYKSAEDMLSDERVSLVSVCAPLRSEQYGIIAACLNARKHVYAEKPSVMTTEELDSLLVLADKTGLIFCEQNFVTMDVPYNKALEIVSSGVLGDIVQVFAQKSYPYGDWRPQDERKDGGLIMQNALYGLRFIEHIAGMKITALSAIETGYGNPRDGGLMMAASIQMRLANGGIGTVVANYLNQPGTGVWGNEELRIFGTKGYLRTDMQNGSVYVYTDGVQEYPFERGVRQLTVLADCIKAGKPYPIPPERLTHPTRLAILAKRSASEGGRWVDVPDKNGSSSL